MTKESIRDEARKLLANEDAMGRFVAESAVEAMIFARRVMNGHVQATSSTRLTAAQKVLDNAKMIIEELRGHEDNRKRKRSSAPAKSSSAVGSRKAWVGGDAKRNPDGTPAKLGKPPVELLDGARPNERDAPDLLDEG